MPIRDRGAPFEGSGFLPCLLNGAPSGFEIDFGSTDDALEDFPHLKEHLGARDCEITFRWGGDMAECACVLIVCAALATDCGAVVTTTPTTFSIPHLS